MLTAQFVRSILDYDPETGVFTWKMRPVSMFKDGKQSAEQNAKKWNTRFAGKTAGVKIGPKAKPYIAITINRTKYRAHRLAWLIVYGEWPPEGYHIDHINGAGLDNRIANLRLATRSQNMANRGAQRNGASGFKGVSWNKQKLRWEAYICINNKQRHLGYFDIAEEAHAAYVAAARQDFGEFARAA